jgi:PadR family transcriptional regulator PadR
MFDGAEQDVKAQDTASRTQSGGAALEETHANVDRRAARVQSSPENLRGDDVATQSDELLRGTLDALILKTLTWGPRHGYGIARWIKATSQEALAVEDRALYLALHRLEDRGWVESDWGLSDNNRRAKYYQLTAKGRSELRAESTRLARYAEGLFRVLNATAWESR